jgi:hypothetical protein
LIVFAVRARLRAWHIKLRQSHTAKPRKKIECDNSTLPESFAANAFKASPDVCDGQGVELARRFSSCEIAYRRQRARVNIIFVNVLLHLQNRLPLQNRKRSTAFAIAPALSRFSHN